MPKSALYGDPGSILEYFAIIGYFQAEFVVKSKGRPLFFLQPGFPGN
jgi:hypothetical protein